MRGFCVVDVVDDVGKPFLGIDSALFTSAEETVKHSDVLSRFMITSKEVILAPQCQGADRVFNQVAVNFQHSVFEVILQTDPSVGTIFKCNANGAFR